MPGLGGTACCIQLTAVSREPGRKLSPRSGADIYRST
nr:MAG TPA_asm: hypothetical protein [Bacteriophage sp.]